MARTKRTIAMMQYATDPVVVEPEFLERLLGCEAQVVEQASLPSASSDLTDSSGSTRAWSDDSEVNEHFALSLACLTAPQDFFVDTHAFHNPRAWRNWRLSRLELGDVATSWIEEESKGCGGHPKTHMAIIAERARSAQREARRRIIDGLPLVVTGGGK